MAEDRANPLEWVAANVRALRVRRGLSQERLAEVAGLDERRVQRLERAEVDVGILALLALATALEVPAGRLLRPAAFTKPRPGRPSKRRRNDPR